VCPELPLKIYKAVQLACLIGILITLVLLLKRPQRLVAPQTTTAGTLAANADSFQNKLGELQQAHTAGQSGVEARINSDEVVAALATANPQAVASGTLNSPTALSADQVPVKDEQVVFEGDQVKGQFTTQLAGKDVVVTFSGRLGSKDGYVNFVPTSFQIGSMPVPASFVQQAFEKKVLSDPTTRDKLKLPDFVNDVKIQNGELVLVER